MARLIKMLWLGILLASPLSAAKTVWYEIQPAQSQITFLVKSRVVKAQGVFRKWDFKGKINGSLQVVGFVSIDCASIDTDNTRRDKHLRDADFFDCKTHPTHTFRITSVSPQDKSALKATEFTLQGELSIKGTTRPVAFKLKREGGEAHFTLKGSFFINRDDYGISYDSALNPIEKQVRIDVKLALMRHTR